MNRRNRRRRKGKSNKMKWAVGVFLTMLLLCAILYMAVHFLLWNQGNSPEEVLTSYMNCISEQKYNEMYEMIDVQNSGNISQEDFVQRNSAIYEGIEVRNMKIQITEYKEAERTVYYESSFDTIAARLHTARISSIPASRAFIIAAASLTEETHCDPRRKTAHGATQVRLVKEKPAAGFSMRRSSRKGEAEWKA